MKILIFFSNEYGGTELLLKRYSEWLKKNGDVVEEIISDRNIKEGSFDLVILPTSQISNIFILKLKRIKFERILIWSMGHGAYRASYFNPLIKTKNKIIRSLNNFLDWRSQVSIKHFLRLNSCVFTDEVGYNFDIKNNHYRNKKKLIYPVPIKNNKNIEYSFKTYKEVEELKICWLGRVSLDFKVYSLIKIINDFENYRKKNIIEKKIVFTVIGDGDGLQILKNRIKNINNMEFKIIKHVDYENLSEEIHKNANYLFAMGTSALDGAKIGCPTIIVQAINNDKDQLTSPYRWIYESKGFSMGEFGGIDVKPKQIAKDFTEIFKNIKEDEDLSVKCKKYSEFFNQENIFLNLRMRELPFKMNIFSSLILFEAFSIRFAKKIVKRIMKK